MILSDDGLHLSVRGCVLIVAINMFRTFFTFQAVMYTVGIFYCLCVEIRDVFLNIRELQYVVMHFRRTDCIYLGAAIK